MKKHLNDAFYPIISAIIVGILLLLTFCATSITPFGESSLLSIDCFHQYSMFAGILEDKISTGESLIMSFGDAGATNFLGNALNYLASPFMLVVVLLGKDNVPLAFSIITILKMVLAAGTFVLFLQKRFNKKTPLLIAFAVLYTLSNFFMAYYWNIMWLDAMYILPLVILGLYSLINERKFLLYTLSLSFAMITNYYMGFMICIASVIFFIFFYIKDYGVKDKFTTQLGKEKSLLLDRFMVFAIMSIIAAIIASIALIPTLQSLSMSGAQSDKYTIQTPYSSPLEFVSAHFSFTRSIWQSRRRVEDASLPNVASSILVLLLSSLYFLSSKISKKEKIASGSILLFFYGSFTLGILNFIWHAFSFPNDIPHRFAYIYLFFILQIAYNGFLHIKEFQKSTLWITFGVIATITILIGCFSAPLKTTLTIPISLIALLIGTILATKMIKHKEAPKAQKIISGLMVFFIIAEIFAPYPFSLKGNGGADIYEQKEVITMAQETVGRDDFYRMEMTKKNSANELSFYNVNNMSAFSSMQYTNFVQLQANLGVEGNWLNSCIYQQMVPTYDMLMGIDYIIQNEKYKIEPPATLYEKIAELNEDAILYRNKLNTGIGYATTSDITKFIFNNNKNITNPFENNNDLLKQLTGIENVFIDKTDVVFTSNDYSIKPKILDKEATIKHPEKYFRQVYEINTDDKTDFKKVFATTIVKETARYYILTNTGAGTTTITINEDEDITSFGEIIDLGILNPGDVIKTTYDISTDYAEADVKYFLYSINEDKIVQAHNKIVDNGPLTVTDYSDSHFVAEINAKTDFIVLNIPYDENWEIALNGEIMDKSDIVETLGGIIGLKVKPGKYTIECTYKNNIVLISGIISLIGVFALIAILIICKKKTKTQ